VQTTEVATLSPGVAGGATELLHLVNDAVAVAVQMHAMQNLHMPALLALAPQGLARTGPVNGAVFLYSQLQGIAVGEGLHQDGRRFPVLGHHTQHARCVLADAFERLVNDGGVTQLGRLADPILGQEQQAARADQAIREKVSSTSSARPSITIPQPWNRRSW